MIREKIQPRFPCGFFFLWGGWENFFFLVVARGDMKLARGIVSLARVEIGYGRGYTYLNGSAAIISPLPLLKRLGVVASDRRDDSKQACYKKKDNKKGKARRKT